METYGVVIKIQEGSGYWTVNYTSTKVLYSCYLTCQLTNFGYLYIEFLLLPNKKFPKFSTNIFETNRINAQLKHILCISILEKRCQIGC